jgi:hypothetical protein
MQAVDDAAPAEACAPQPGAGVLARWLPVLLVCMVACGTLYAAAAPRSGSFVTQQASLGALLQDVDRGLVHTVYVDGDNIVWRPDGARTWSAAEMRGFGNAGKPINGLDDVMAEATAVNHSADLVIRPQDHGWRWMRRIGILGGFGAFLLLIAGPQPQRASRWAWFWLFYIGRSSGLGVLAFLLLGTRPRRSETSRHHAAEPRERIDGFQGFAIAFVVGLVLSILGAVLHDYTVGNRSGSTSYTYDQAARPR